MAVCKINFIENRKVLKLQYVRICHLLNSYSKQLGGSLSPEKSLIAANCIFIIHPYTLTVAVVTSGSCADSQCLELWTPEVFGPGAEGTQQRMLLGRSARI